MKRTTLISVIVFLGLILLGIFVTTRRPERGITRISFASIKTDQVDQITITGKNPVELKKHGEIWKVGTDKVADPDSVKRLLEALPKMNSSDEVTRSTDKFSELEVDAEKGSTVKVLSNGKELANFVVGKAAGGGVHVRVNDVVYKVAGIYPGVFSHDAASWLQRKLFDMKLEDATKLEVFLRNPERRYVLSKIDKDWSLAEIDGKPGLPKDFRFDKGAAASLVSSVVNLRAKDVLDGDPGLDKTQLGDQAEKWILTMSSGQGEQKTEVHKELVLGATLEDKSVYAKVADNADVVTLPDTTVKNLRKDWQELRDLRLLDVAREKIVRMSINDGKSQLQFDKGTDGWKMTKHSEKEPVGFEFDPQAVERRLTAVLGTRALKIADLKESNKSGLGNPSASLNLTLEGGKVITLAFGAATKTDDKDTFYARGNADTSIYLVNKWTRDNVVAGIASFKKQAEAPNFGNLDPKALSNLPPEVRQQLMQQMQQKQREQQMMQQIQQQMAKQENKPATTK